MSYDTWKATNRDDERLGRSNGKPQSFRCVQCEWRGKGILQATQHWYATSHNVKPASDPRFRQTAQKKASA